MSSALKASSKEEQQDARNHAVERAEQAGNQNGASQPGNSHRSPDNGDCVHKYPQNECGRYGITGNTGEVDPYHRHWETEDENCCRREGAQRNATRSP